MEKGNRFGKKGKLSPPYIGPCEILKRTGPIAYCLALPPKLSGIHDVFHVSMLRRYRSDPSHVLRNEQVEIKENLSYIEESVQILKSNSHGIKSKLTVEERT